MKRHLQTKHPDHAQKTKDFFQRKEKDLQGQKQVITQRTTTPAKAQTASYAVAYLIAQRKEAHTIGEDLIKPAAVAMCRAMHGEKVAGDLDTIPLSNDTVRRRIHDIADDIRCQLIERVKNVRYALQIDESTDISNSAQLLVFIRYSFDGRLHEDMLFCSTLEGTCTGDAIFTELDSKLREMGLLWDQCVGVCIGGAGAMLGERKGLRGKIMQVASNVNFAHCIIHREALASEALVPELNSVLETAIKIVNFIKSQPLNARLFAILCKDMGSDYEALLLHTEARWFSRGKVLTHLYQVRYEVRLFLLECGSTLSVHLCDSIWLAKLAYLASIYEKLNELNLSIQGPNTNILTKSDKVNAFRRKLERWAVRYEEGNVEMFPLLEEFVEENELHACLDNMRGAIAIHLRSLFNHFKKYFKEETTPQQHDWIQQPFTATGSHLPSDLENALLELSSDGTLRMKFESTTLDKFWISVAEEYPGLSKTAMNHRPKAGDAVLQEANPYFPSIMLSKELSLECELEDVEELLDQEPGELTNEELIELEEERMAEEKTVIDKNTWLKLNLQKPATDVFTHRF
ncbi:zinc finger BED domain-containing protein 5-like [Oratosquilla oratoria]|uniref:zinc finger BED domain-containing protein 5-like n=1 Tax=Oratosquilla oratoria TaxID=337810 RepID=UPI003F75F9A3